MDNFKGTSLGRRSLRIANGIGSNLPMKPLGVSNSQSSYERKNDMHDSLQKSPIRARKTLFEPVAKENGEFALCKDFSSNRENTGASPVVIIKKNSIGSSNGSQENKKVRPRRSMLGLRSKRFSTNFANDDNTLQKPKLSSLPDHERSDSDGGDTKLKPLYQKSSSMPQITPFDSDDLDTSAFFNKGISDSAWSVFKKPKSTYEAPVTRGSVMSGKARQLRQSLASSVDKEVKLKWLSQTFQKEKNIPVNGIGPKENSADLYSSGSEETTTQEESENRDSTIHEEEDNQHNISLNNLTISSSGCISPIKKINYNDTNELNESSSSTDSYIQNETIIQNQLKNNLEKIDEEGFNSDSYCEDNDSNCKEIAATDSDRLIALFEDIKNEKENLDIKWFAFMKQKEVFDNKWNSFESVMRTYRDNRKTTTKNSSKRKKVICTKLRKSNTSSPRVGPMPFKSSERCSSKPYSEFKTDLISKTPISADKRFKMLRKSLCYTPNTLSRKVDEQANDIFGEI